MMRTMGNANERAADSTPSVPGSAYEAPSLIVIGPVASLTHGHPHGHWPDDFAHGHWSHDLTHGPPFLFNGSS
jgi:hypothetical protein